MSTNKKPSSLAQLKNLSPERQAEIYSRLTVKTAAWPDTSYKAVRRWLKDDGLETSEAALSMFYSWYALRDQLSRNASTVETLLAELKKSKPDLSPEDLDKAGQMFFTALSIEQKDSLGWQRAQNVKIKQGALALESRRIALLEKRAALADQTEKVLTDAELSPAEREQRIKEIYGRA